MQHSSASYLTQSQFGRHPRDCLVLWTDPNPGSSLYFRNYKLECLALTLPNTAYQRPAPSLSHTNSCLKQNTAHLLKLSALMPSCPALLPSPISICKDPTCRYHKQGLYIPPSPRLMFTCGLKRGSQLPITQPAHTHSLPSHQIKQTRQH